MSFVVEKDGTFSELKIAKGVRQDLDDEALRVVKLSPIWNPALKRGIPQKTSYTIPVFFQLDLKY
jgi:outer membrane biosynthesis protein TonB